MVGTALSVNLKISALLALLRKPSALTETTKAAKMEKILINFFL